MMELVAAHTVLSDHRTDEVVVTEMTSALQWPFVSRRQELDLCLFDCMGKASSIGLGIALARPDRKVIVLDADGSLLMNLGSLVTIASLAPPNLIHFVCQNDEYEVTGGQPIPGAGRLSFAGAARAAGYAHSYTFDRVEDFAARVGQILTEPGPTFVCLRVLSTERSLPLPARLTAQAVPEVTAALARS